MADSNLIRAGKAEVEITAKDNTKVGLDAAEKNLKSFNQKAKAALSTPVAQLNTETIKAQELAKRGATLTLNNRSAAEKFADTQRELNDLLKVGAINHLTHGRAARKAAEDLAAASGPGSKIGEALGKFGLAKTAIGGAAEPLGKLGGGVLAAGAVIASLATGYKQIFDYQQGQVDVDRGLYADARGRYLSNQAAAEIRRGGRPALNALVDRRQDEFFQARAAQDLEWKRRNTFLGGRAPDLFSMGVDAILGDTGKLKALKVNTEIAAKALADLTAQSDATKAAFAEWHKDFRDTTDLIGLTPERARLAQLEKDRAPKREIDQARKDVEERERKAAGQAVKDLVRSFLVEGSKIGLPPEAGALLDLKEDFSNKKKLSSEEIRATLADPGLIIGGVATIRKRGQQELSDFLSERTRQLANQKELDALASPLRDAAFRGQLGLSGGYDYGGGGQWREEMKSTAQEQRDIARESLITQQGTKAVQERTEKSVQQFLDVFRIK